MKYLHLHDFPAKKNFFFNFLEKAIEEAVVIEKEYIFSFRLYLLMPAYVYFPQTFQSFSLLNLFLKIGISKYSS